MTFSEHDTYGSGLNRKDWYLLRDAVLFASHNSPVTVAASTGYDAFPERLRAHEIAQIVASHLSGDSTASLDRAVSLLVGGNDNGWLVILKS